MVVKIKSTIHSIFSAKIFTPAFVLVSGLVLFFLLWFSTNLLPPEFANNPYLGALLRLWCFLAFAFTIMVVLKTDTFEYKGLVIAGLLGLCFTGMVMLGLKNTPYSLNGISGDAGLLTAQITKFSAYSSPVDFAYKGLPPFYPPLYMWILGKVSGMLAIEPYRMLKYGLIAISFVLPFFVYFAWSWLRPTSLAVAIVLSLVIFQDWYKPYEWLSMVVFIPWWLYFVDGLGLDKPKKRILWFVIGGIMGAALFATYYYWFFVGAASLLVHSLIKVGKKSKRQRLSRDLWINRILILFATLLFSAPYWGPLLRSMWMSGNWSVLQNRYFIPDFNVLRLPFIDFSIDGLVLLGGLVYLISFYNRDKVARGILALLIGAYLWQLIGYIGLLSDVPILSFKARDFVVCLLALASALGAVNLWLSLNPSIRKKWSKFVAVGVVVLSLFYSQKVATGFADNELLQKAQNTEYPVSFLSEFSKKNPNHGINRVVLADASTSEISAYYPVFQFIPWAAVYSHPAGEYYERLEFVRKLSELTSPEWFAAAFMNNRYDRIDGIILFPEDGGFRLEYLPEKFPASSEAQQIFFTSGLLDPNYFSDMDLDGYVLFSPHYEKNPLADLPPIQTYDASRVIPGIGDGEDFYSFLTTFEGHLSFPGLDGYHSLLETIFGPR